MVSCAERQLSLHKINMADLRPEKMAAMWQGRMDATEKAAL